MLPRVPHDPHLAIVDSFPLPVCQFAQAYRRHRLKGEAAYGKEELVRQTFFGFQVHVRLCWPGASPALACPSQRLGARDGP